MRSSSYSCLTIFPLNVVIILSLLAIGCSDDESRLLSTPKNAMVGFFIDGPVQGLQYETPTWSGITDFDGRFYYMEGEEITFFLGGLILGSLPAQAIITPMDLMKKPLMRSNSDVINVSRLLLTLDEDNNPNNGIAIPDSVKFSLSGVSLDLTDPDLENNSNLLKIFSALNDLGIYPEEIVDLISAEEAQIHLEQTMSKIITEGLDQKQDVPAYQDLQAIIDIPYSYIFLAPGQSLDLSGSVYGGTGPYTYTWSINNAKPFSFEEDPQYCPFDVTGVNVLSFKVIDALGRVSSDARLIIAVAPYSSQRLFEPFVLSLLPSSETSFLNVGDIAEFQVMIHGELPLYLGWTLGDTTGNFYDLTTAAFSFILWPPDIIVNQPIHFTSFGSYPVEAVVKDASGSMASATYDISVGEW